jgi:hypothetical protein
MFGFGAFSVVGRHGPQASAGFFPSPLGVGFFPGMGHRGVFPQYLPSFGAVGTVQNLRPRFFM